ncbi:uroporphyrinogen-III synthase [Actimicrobium sp. CCI2.3]|uniref:uroporphyrinogen-III synthase n=1 Tax=Actimicrobium sp. CCI2.3 TaxID=3048616 RepID=UPI002AB3E85E|nr:uroporphyrinogen-III synthase [Actimicrobium sp. CCI2.3]MDY7572774.1 uroporphyrinogen-III synthase [Actimicrobium sp. CCI2.3]MEB0020619.1 uroporphyrinogen-III synthase [Actimicrobium sp. CCI2.3]
MLRKLVITRPLAQSLGLAQVLRDGGREVVILPLLDILPLPDEAALQAVLAQLESFALVAFVSPNAIDAAFAQVATWPVSVPLAVMGEGSRRALARHGVTAGPYQITSPLDTQRTDSQTLLQALDLPRLQGQRVLIIRGDGGRELLADAMRDAGIDVQQVAAYRRVAPRLDAALRQRLTDLLAQDCDWIITSSEALQVLMGFVQQVDAETGVGKIQHKNVFVPHRRIAETAVSLGFRYVFLTGSGDEGLLTALQSRP